MQRIALVGLLLTGISVAVAWVLQPGGSLVQEAHADDVVVQVKPVEEDMHELMEYVFEPPYKRLKAALASPPTEKSVWKSIKSDSLILAEAGNLLIGRTSEDSLDVWNQYAEATRTTGSLLYSAAKKGDAAEARRSWEGLLQSCNACHEQFAGGEHLLEP